MFEYVCVCLCAILTAPDANFFRQARAFRMASTSVKQYRKSCPASSTCSSREFFLKPLLISSLSAHDILAELRASAGTHGDLDCHNVVIALIISTWQAIEPVEIASWQARRV